jgi:hypothetical protein
VFFFYGNNVIIIFCLGTAIYWHSRRNPVGAVADITLDGALVTTVDASAGFTNISQSPVPAILFAKDNLTSAQHTIKISNSGIGSLGGSYLESYYFE